ncbi:hypothetical protein MMC30_008543 [Trapelia coarctata]|nr:hypothetical protein [Trapelia coarctata]
MPGALDNEKPGRISVPTVDIAPFLADPTSTASQKIVETVRRACTSTGFFQITGHGLSTELQKPLFQASRKFFALDSEEKKKLDAKTTVGRRGYDVLASQSYDPNVAPDLKEGFYIGHDLPLEHPVVQAQRFFMGPNVWPDRSVLAPEDFKAPVEAYFQAIHSLALKVLDLVARTLPYGPNIFDEFTAGNTIAPLRLLHYPPAPPPEAEGAQRQLGAGAHTDFGAITLLLQDEQPGLEVLDTVHNEFVPVDPTPNAFVFNVGDMLSAWTGGAYKSSVHRVINKNPTDRYSAAFFFNGSLDCPLVPFDGSGGVAGDGKEHLTVEKHMIRRIQQSYGTAGKN